MSLNLYLYGRNTCPHCGSFLEGELIWENNITHNLVPMWERARVYEALYLSDRQLADKYVTALSDGMTRLLQGFAEYKAMEPANGWGKAEHAAAFLWSTYLAFRNNPDAMIRVSK